MKVLKSAFSGQVHFDKSTVSLEAKDKGCQYFYFLTAASQ